MKKIFFLFTLLGCFSLVSFSQNSYRDSLQSYLDHYVAKHEVVTGEDKKQLHFFKIDEQYRVNASFEKKENGWFEMPTSGRIKKLFRLCGVLRFTIHDTTLRLNVYQSQNLMGSDEYKDYLFLPFTDLTTGGETYESGRYIDLRTTDIHDGHVLLDFNKAYNPYCAYVSGKYNCPIPPKENSLPVAIRAGEMKYGKH